MEIIPMIPRSLPAWIHGESDPHDIAPSDPRRFPRRRAPESSPGTATATLHDSGVSAGVSGGGGGALAALRSTMPWDVRVMKIPIVGGWINEHYILYILL